MTRQGRGQGLVFGVNLHGGIMNHSGRLKYSLPAPRQRLSNIRPVPGIADTVLLHQVELPELLVMSDGEASVTGCSQSAHI